MNNFEFEFGAGEIDVMSLFSTEVDAINLIHCISAVHQQQNV